MVGDCHLRVNRSVQADGKVSRMGFYSAIDSARCSVGLGEEAVVDNISRASSLWKYWEIA